MAVLEFQSGWLTQANPAEATLKFPMRWPDSNREGLYKQLSWAANELTRGFTLWGYRALAVWTLADSNVIRIDPTINAGTAGVQYLLGLLRNRDPWFNAVSEGGFIQTYRTLFGDPFAFTQEPLLPEGLSQPTLQLPCPGRYLVLYRRPALGWGTGSPYASLDFCAFRRGIIVLRAGNRSRQWPRGGVLRNAQVVIDLDGDVQNRPAG